MDKKIKNLKQKLDKHFRSGDLILFEEQPDKIEIVPTTIYSLDRALGVGGIPRGRMIEVYGPESGGKTTLALYIVAAFQQAGGVIGYIDMEQTLDLSLAQTLGVDTKSLVLAQPDSAEKALEIMEDMVRSGSVSLIVLDSVAALVPQVEVDGEYSETNMGVAARLMSKACRKLNPLLSKTNTTIVWINQIRHKIGGYGCFNYDTLVNFEKGESIPIGKVVDKKITGNVYCFNADTQSIEVKPILDWHDNGKIKNSHDFIHIQTSSIDGKGRFGFTCTPEHKILTPKGWVKTKNLKVEDKLISKYKQTINGFYGDFLRGVLVGDSCIRIRDKNTGNINLQDNVNPDYIKWKLKKLAPFISFIRSENNRGFIYKSKYSYEFSKIKLSQRDPMFLLNNYTNIGLAVWIMDDGHFDANQGHRRYSISVKRLKGDRIKLNKIRAKLNSLGLFCSIDFTQGQIKFKTSTTDIIVSRIKSFIPKCMQYKLPIEYQGQYKEFHLSNKEILIPESVIIKEIRFASPRQMRNKHKFDLTVEGNHNYLVGGKYNGVVVHNSPEVTTGGNALKFYCSQRIEIRKGTAIKPKDTLIGHDMIAKVVKNKLAAPFTRTTFPLIYGWGVDKVADIRDLAVNVGVIQQSGASYKFKGEKIAHGKERVAEVLAKDSKLLNKIIEEIEDGDKKTKIVSRLSEANQEETEE